MLDSLAQSLIYPPVGFHFAVVFEFFPPSPQDFRFQEVSGLTATMTMEDVIEGGQNRFTKKLPKRTSYGDLTLKRGFFVGSRVRKWCKDAIEDFEFEPMNLTITLLNGQHMPLSAWYVVNAIPVEWSVSDFNAMENKITVETLKLNYDYFRILSV